MVFVFGLQTFSLIDFTKNFQSKGLKPKNKGHANFYECCDLTKKVQLNTCNVEHIELSEDELIAYKPKDMAYKCDDELQYFLPMIHQ